VLVERKIPSVFTVCTSSSLPKFHLSVLSRSTSFAYFSPVPFGLIFPLTIIIILPRHTTAKRPWKKRGSYVPPARYCTPTWGRPKNPRGSLKAIPEPNKVYGFYAVKAWLAGGSVETMMRVN
jgi:hypothetical protein